jgi:hypothetical protein
LCCCWLAGSRKNIEEHYDAGNAMYATFLDQSMTYSAGIHTEEQQGDLRAAQMAKLDAVIAAADLQPSDHVLEIGCGWGSFAMRAASTHGCRYAMQKCMRRCCCRWCGGILQAAHMLFVEHAPHWSA